MKQIIFLLVIFLAGSVANAQSDPATLPASRNDSSEYYGLVPSKPIKVGGATTNGVANQRKYLESLRDAQGNPITYERKGSCCAYPSENGFAGYALLDRYEVKYRDADNKKKTVILYISFYDFEELKPVKGFTLVD